MITKIFSVLDIKTGAYMQPFFSATIPSAIRSVGDAAMDPNSMLGKHREDFQLYLLGSFDDATGLIIPEEHITPLGSLVEMAPAPEHDNWGSDPKVVAEMRAQMGAAS